MKSAFILVSSFLAVAAVHGSVLLETRANDQGKNQGKGNDLQGGNATFSIHPNCTTPGKPHRCVFKMHALSVASLWFQQLVNPLVRVFR
jgi:hypothetical protein